jgi:hypothetical protein
VSFYSDVADLLPADIIEAIEVSLPCPVAFIHLWDHERTDDDEFWHCVHCHAIALHDPRAPEIRDLDRYITIERLT